MAQAPAPVERDWNTASTEEIQIEIDRRRRAGVPRDASRGSYMTLHRILRDRAIKASGVAPAYTNQDLIGRLYADTDIPIQEIVRAAQIHADRLSQIRKRLGIPNREDIRPWRPKGHKIEGDELFIEGTQAYFRNPIHGTRPVWEEAPEVPEPAPEPEPELEAVAVEPVAENGRVRIQRKKRHILRQEERAEVARLYADPSIPLHEVERAYDISGGGIDRIRIEYGVPKRRDTPGFAPTHDRKGHFEIVDGRPQWVPDAAPQTQEWMSHESAALVADEVRHAALQPAPQPAPQHPNVAERSWVISYITTRTETLPAPDLEEALRRAREQWGADIDVQEIRRL